VAEGGEELFDLGPVTGGAGDFFVTEDQDLKILVAFHAVIFKDGHTQSPYSQSVSFFNITPLGTFFQSFRNFLVLAFRDIVCNACYAYLTE
jgi:hypothetical protein